MVMGYRDMYSDYCNTVRNMDLSHSSGDSELIARDLRLIASELHGIPHIWPGIHAAVTCSHTG